ncbi:phytanoyl-CoA dioxygenase family protein [Tolypothrix sp. PCC 7910]|uniref:phytanoyl-CoA dioxygenase family protein n=1 Tax=Tolypothrix sp. PCC 7910 TaxID=2099387 RepID=UPI001FCC1FA9|nr:phytanoyl-CoA dioxygenase family protein [Tolypothrix sp. PCC 7910]
MSLHQDPPLINNTLLKTFGVWVPLIDVKEQNGCLQVVKRSHLLNSKNRPFISIKEFKCSREVLTSVQQNYLTSIPMKAGQALIYDKRLFHGSPPNSTAVERVAAICSLVPENISTHFCYRESPNSDQIEIFEVDDEFYNTYIGEKPEGVKSLGISDYEIEPLTPEILIEKLGKKTSYPKLPLSTNTSINFNPQFLEKLPPSPQKIAILATNEYEGIFRNGGIGTYYQTLSQKLAAEGWYVVLLLCQSQQKFGGDSHIPALKHIFSTSECFDVLNLQPMHLAILSQFKEWEWVDYENYCALFFAQAIASAFSRSFIYIEFPETLGLGYCTIQAKRAGVLGKNCSIAVTLHSGQEWLYEAHGKYASPVESWYLQTSHYEQSAFEQADLAFFPSYFLKAKVESYGWKTNHALHLPYFIPEIEPLLEKPEPLRGDLRLELNPHGIPIIFFGRLEERKGLMMFIEAIKLLDTDITQKIQIIFVGKTVQLQVEELKHLDSEQYIRQQLDNNYSYSIISDLYSQEAIGFINQLNHPIVCLTSHQENFPNAALEMGQLPVNLVVSDTGGFREALNLIERKQGIHWFTPSDARSLMQSLKIAISTYSETPSIPSQDSIYKTNQLLLLRRLKYLNLVIRQSKIINSNSRNGQPSSQSLQRLVELEKPQDYLSEVDKELFPIASDKLSMLSFEERSYLQNYTKYEYTGSGEIVDLGCWLGSSTIPLAMGLNDNSKVDSKEERIHAYDIFVWEPYMNKHLNDTSLEGKYQDGDSFVEEFIERIHPWNHLIQVYPGDLNRIGWDKHPIEFLFIDAMKSWELANSILRNFFPSLIPGLSLVVHQDFAHFYEVWIHLIMYRLRDYLVPLEDHPFLYSSKVFRYIKAIPEELLQNFYSLASFSEEEAEAAFDYSLAITPKRMKSNVAAVKVMYFIQVGNVERAKLELSQARAKYERSEWSDLVDVEEWLERANWFKQYR